MVASIVRALPAALAGLALAALSGLVFTLAFPPYGLWPLIAVGFVPAVVAQHRVAPRPLAGLAYGVGFGGFYWGYFGPMFAGLHTIMAWVPLFAAVIATLASGGSRAFHQRTGYRWFVLEGAVVWVGVEAIRAFLPMIGTGGSVAFALYAQPWLIQPVGIFGIFGLGLLIMVCNYALALGCLALLDRRFATAVPVPARQAGRQAGAVALAGCAWVGLSIALLGQAAVPGASVRVAAIQPAGAASAEAHMGTLFSMTRQAAAKGAQLIVWPEGTLNFDPRGAQAERIGQLARDTGAYLVLGYGYRRGAGMVNEAVVVAPSGEFLAPFGKDHPVVWMGESSLTRGTYPTHPTPLGRLGTVICYDLNFTDTSRNMAANGAQIIAVPSNDWPALATKQYTNLVLRAVENRVTLIKADGGYDSAIIGPSGAIVARQLSTGLPQPALLVADVPIGRANAPLIWLGDWVGWLCIGAMAAFVALDIVTARAARRRERLGRRGVENFADADLQARQQP